MKKTVLSKKILLSIISVALVAAMALGFGACGDNGSTNDTSTTIPTENTTNAPESVTELGVGEKAFAFEVKDKDGSVVKFNIKTDAETVGAALLEQKLIAGADSEYGLMVDTVNGIKYDYTADKMYWAFYINGEYAMTGVDQTTITDGAVYSFVATAA